MDQTSLYPSKPNDTLKNLSLGGDHFVDRCVEEEELNQPKDTWMWEDQIDRLCSFYVNNPKITFAVCFALQLSLVITTAFLYLTNYTILPYDFSPIPLNLEKDYTKLRADAFNFAAKDPRINLHPMKALPQTERSVPHSPLEIIFKSRSLRSILTTSNLKAISATERHLYQHPKFKRICQQDSTSNQCVRPLSVLRLFDGSYSDLNPIFNDPGYDNIENVIKAAWKFNATRALLAFSLDKNAIVNDASMPPQATYVRLILFHGLPLAGYKNAEDRRTEQEEDVKLSVINAFSSYLNQLYQNGVSDMNVYYLSLPLFYHAIEHQVIYDLLLAAGSLVFIFCYIWLQTGSFWITSWAIFAILTNFFGANLIYRIVLDFRYIGIFHVLSVFIILGIGADDVFVFYNTWKLMEKRGMPNLVIQLRETFRSAAGAMFVTSLTTTAAFLASAASPLLGVSSFGVFSGVLVLVNYISVCIFLPIVVITHHLYWKTIRSNHSTLIPAPFDKIKLPSFDHVFYRVVAWFSGPFADFVLHKTVRWFILGFYVFISLIFVGFAVRLKPQEDQVQVWPRGTNWYEMRKIRVDHFTESGAGTNVIRVYLVWGLKQQDRTKCHFTDYKCEGETQLDEDINLNDPDCQTGILNICHKLKTMRDAEAGQFKIRRSIATGDLEVECFMDTIDRFLKNDARRGMETGMYQNETTLQIPVDEEIARTIIKANPHMYNVSLVKPGYNRFFEIATGYWLSNRGQPGYDFIKYGGWLGGSLDESATKIDKFSLAQGNRHGNKLRYVAVVVNLTITGATLKHNEGVTVLDKWEQFINSERSHLPSDCRQAFQCTPEWNNWHWLRVQEVLLHGAIQGIIIGLGVALPVLTLTTMNWIIGLLATLAIGLVTLAVVGLIPMLGWSLGVMESLNLTLVVGLSVDYAVHLADGYVRSKKFSREERVKDMLAHVGVSVLAGASTTLGASAFMLGAKILFFFQFGIFMFCTIGFSLIYALGFFTVIVGILGPEGDKGTIRFCNYKTRRSDRVPLNPKDDNTKSENDTNTDINMGVIGHCIIENQPMKKETTISCDKPLLE